jgi:hypothetical protein
MGVLMKVTNEILLEKMEEMDGRIVKIEEVMNKGKGAVSVIVWLGSISAIVGGYFYQK